MMQIIKKGCFLALVCMLLGCLTIQAADNLITEQITIKLDKAGTLPDKIGSSKRDKITNLKIVGEMSAGDFDVIRSMGGSSRGHLAILDLSEVKIVGRASTGTEEGGLPSGAFVQCSSLTSLSLPSGVTSIGSSAFSGCSGLTSLTIPSGVTSIGQWAFEGCSGLTSLTIPSGVTSIGYGAFEGCSGLASLTIPSGVTSIVDHAFFGCSGLTSLILPSGVTSIGSSAFSYCSGLTSLAIPSGVTFIGDSAFWGCSGLTSIYVSWEIPLSTRSIGVSAFYKVDRQKCTLYVPKGTFQDYWLADVWGDFENIVEYDVTGIDKVTTSTDAKEVSRYSVNGQRLSAPTKGLNIVKYSDGSVKKVAVQ